jgi:predicted anti-sigma-YlaC factor YlaD
MTGQVPEPYPGDSAHRVICQQVVELLTDYLEDALDADLRQDVERHLDACPECRLFLGQLTLSTSLLASTDDVVSPLGATDSLPESTVQALVDRFGDLLTP